jgi:putative hemolysin
LDSIHPSSGQVAPVVISDPLRSIRIEKGNYRLRVATSREDVLDACALRFRIFNVEMGEGLDASFETGLDQDHFDAQCHHLLVEYAPLLSREFRIVGTYRVQTQEAALAGAGFYSACEFELNSLPQGLLEEAVELGRACISLEHRNRSVLLLLWRGLCAYSEAQNKRYFFGCNSLTSQDTALGWATYHWLVSKGHARPDFLVRPLPEWRCGSPTAADDVSTRVKIPPLFAAYMRYGSKICSEPAIDREFGTIDFLTVHDLIGMAPKERARLR